MEPDVTPEAAIYHWLSGFGVPAYASTSTPDEDDEEWAGYPYITYDLVVGDWGQGEANMAVNLWDRTDSEARLNAKVREMRESLKHGGVQLRCDGGAVWLKQGSPWAQSVRVEGEDEKVKRRYVNVNVEYLLSA